MWYKELKFHFAINTLKNFEAKFPKYIPESY